MRVTSNWISTALYLGIFAWFTWLTVRGGDWREIAQWVVLVVALIGVGFRWIWAKYLIYILAATGVLWIAYQIWLEIYTGRWFIRKEGLAEAIGTPLTTILGLFSLAAMLLLYIGGACVVHSMYKKTEQDRQAGEQTGDSSSPPAKPSDTQ
jgi:hypothetical protein